MRKAQKQEVLEMIQTLHQAHDEIKNYIDKKNYALAQDILSQCQECAISIGTAIEKFEGEGFVTVSYVETYCDVMFSVYEELNGNDANANKAHKNLKKQLLRIENSVKNDVPVRKEIAFFPYKASMWDALESVYLEAKKDPNCDAYCVPIPYYDRNPDKSLGEMHYEGREYPKNIEVIDWQTYNFEERKPDVIYIHNPYDDWNLVTCVHPRYFSANLKKYTEELVYIPYFVLDEIEPDDQVRIDGIKHFCFLPGVVNADKVIVQSEKMKQIYVNEYLKAALANGLSGDHIERKKLEEKFLGLGSPKFDKVKNTKKEDLEMPAEWLKIIEKPDGSWKKIVFYNTSIAALLENNEKMLEKMEYVFSVFKEQKDEVALLWRPHPLIKTTVSAIRPQLWAAYDKLVKQYRKEGWGIYDDSADMDRAVVLSDAYYGDMSSVVQVYQKTGKPAMIQNVFVRTWRKEETLWAIGSDIFKGTMYLPAFNMNALIQIDMMSQKACIIPYRGMKTFTNRHMYDELKVVNDIVFFAPTNANCLLMYHILSGKFEYEEILCEEIKQYPKYVSDSSFVVLNENKVFYIGIKQTSIVMTYDLETQKKEYIVNSFLNHRQDEKRLFVRQACIFEKKVLIPIFGTNILYVLDSISNKAITMELPIGERAIKTINNKKEKVYCTLNDGCVLEWDFINNECCELAHLPSKQGYEKSLMVDDFMYLYPADLGYNVIKYNLNELTYIELEKTPEYVLDVMYDTDRKKIYINTIQGVFEQLQEGEYKKISLDISCEYMGKLLKPDIGIFWASEDKGAITLHELLEKLKNNLYRE